MHVIDWYVIAKRMKANLDSSYRYTNKSKFRQNNLYIFINTESDKF